MWPHVSATLRFALRTPMTWSLMLAAGVAGWFAATFDILALEESASASAGVIAATAQFAGALVVAWLVVRTLDEDSESGWTAAVDVTAPGFRVRHLGRWAGSVVAAALTALGAIILSSLATGTELASLISLSITTIVAIALVGAWAALLSARWRGGAVVLVVLLIWFAGHLPWGHASFAPGWPGRVLRAWLPAPNFDLASLRAWGQHGFAAAGLLLACGVAARPGQTS